MAGLSTKAIKTRIKSMQSTRQITKAMELVAASKLRSAQAKAISSRPYFQTLYAAMDEIADTNNDFTSPYLHANPNGKPAYVVIAGDRGLAGGYNNNILKLAYSQMAAPLSPRRWPVRQETACSWTARPLRRKWRLRHPLPKVLPPTTWMEQAMKPGIWARAM